MKLKLNHLYTGLHLSASMVSAMVQLAVLPLLKTAFGDRGGFSSLVVGMTMLGIAIGQSGMISIRGARRFLIGLSILCGCLSFYYGPVLVFVASNSWAVIPFVFFVAAVLISAGLLISGAIYFRTEFSRNYFWHNILCGLVAVMAVAFRPTLNFEIAWAAIAVALALIGFMATGLSDEKTPLAEIQWSLRNTGEGIFLGLVSGGYVFCVLQLIYLSLSPFGHEFPMYLVGVFLALACAGLVRNGRLLNWGMEPAFPLGLFIGLLIVVFGDTSVHAGLPAVLPRSYWKIEVILVALLLLPYFFFALILPALQKQSQKRSQVQNHLLSVTLGNALAIFLFNLLPQIDLQLKILVTLLLGLAHAVLFRRDRQMVRAGFFVVAIVVVFAFVRRLDQHAVELGFLLQQRAFTENESPRFEFSETSFEAFARSHGQVGYIYRPIPGKRFLGLGGYRSPINRPVDFIRAMAAKRVVEIRRPHRVLVLGLGNQIILKYLEAGFASLESHEFEVDVVENSPLFEELDFRNDVGRVSDFTWPRRGFNFISDDAFRFLGRSRDSRTYDVIIENLTKPTYGSATNLFTAEFRQLIGRALAPRGLLITEFLPDRSILCLNARQFWNNRLYPRLAETSVVLSSMDELSDVIPLAISDGHPTRTDCESTKRLTLGRPFMRGLIENDIFPGDFVLPRTIRPIERDQINDTSSALLEAHGGDSRHRIFAFATGDEKTELERTALLAGLDKMQKSAFHVIDTLGSLQIGRRQVQVWSEFLQDRNTALIRTFYQGQSFPLTKNDRQPRNPQSYWISLPSGESASIGNPHRSLPNLLADLARYLQVENLRSVDLIASHEFLDAESYLEAVKAFGLPVHMKGLHEYFNDRSARRETTAEIFLLAPNDLDSIAAGLQNDRLIAKIFFFDERFAQAPEDLPELPNSVTYFFWYPERDARACAFGREYRRRFGLRPSPRAGLLFDTLDGSRGDLRQSELPSGDPLALIQPRTGKRRFNVPLNKCEI